MLRKDVYEMSGLSKAGAGGESLRSLTLLVVAAWHFPSRRNVQERGQGW